MPETLTFCRGFHQVSWEQLAPKPAWGYPLPSNDFITLEIMCDWIYPDLSGFIQICPDLLMIYPPILILETPMFTMFTMFKMPISSMDPPIFLAPPSRSCWCSGLPIPKDPDLQNSFVGWIMLDPKFNPGWWCHPIKKKTVWVPTGCGKLPQTTGCWFWIVAWINGWVWKIYGKPWFYRHS